MSCNISGEGVVTAWNAKRSRLNLYILIYMILYPTETIYGLGVNPFDEAAMAELFELKGRDERKVTSWLVRSMEDVAHYAHVSDKARRIAGHFLPGPLTLVLPAKDTVPTELQSEEGNIGFRISSDPLAKELVDRFFQQYNSPVTCTSANVSGMDPENTPAEIIKQFKEHRPGFEGFSEVIDGGERGNLASTVVGVFDDEVKIYRVGSISQTHIMATISSL